MGCSRMHHFPVLNPTILSSHHGRAGSCLPGIVVVILLPHLFLLVPSLSLHSGFAFIAAAAQAPSDGGGDVKRFVFVGNPDAVQLFRGIPPAPFNLTNITRWRPATDFTVGGTALCLTQEIPATYNASQNIDASGRGLYYLPIRMLDASTKAATSFSTMFSFWIEINSLYPPGEGLAFIMTVDNHTSSVGAPGKYLGWLNSSNNNDQSLHNFAIEFDIVKDLEFGDPDSHHVGVNLNSLNSTHTESFGYYKNHRTKKLTPLTLMSDVEKRSYVWIEYDGPTQVLNVTVSDGERKPIKPLLSTTVNLSSVLNEFMYVGFTASTGDTNHMAQHTVYDWSFTNFGEAYNIYSTESLDEMTNHHLLTITVPCAVLIVTIFLILVVALRCRRHSRGSRRKFQVSELDERNFDYGLRKYNYKELSDATKKFSEVIGKGGFGFVYKGEIDLNSNKQPTVVAVKRITKESKQGAREFIAEVQSIGRMRHRNLVPLLGWCHKESTGELLLVYKFMSHGSLDKYLSPKKGTTSEAPVVLSWPQRMHILKGVATALNFLHKEYEQQVLHQDVKDSNVMLDSEFNARLSDFGLARLNDHSKDPKTTAVVRGTPGYIAPELVHDMRATDKTDVYSFGVLALQLATGKPALSSEKKSLADWVWTLHSLDQLMEGSDSKLESFDKDEMALVLHMGMMCTYPDPDGRPTMGNCLSYLEGEKPFPVHLIPPCKPLPMFALSLERSVREGLRFSNSSRHSTSVTGSTIFTDTYSRSHEMDFDDTGISTTANSLVR